MRTLAVLLLSVAIVACGGSTEPKGGDPSLLITNNLDHDWVQVVWQDGNSIFGRDSVPPRMANQCVRFTAQPDSAYWSITTTPTNANGIQMGRFNQTAPFFNPADRPAWKVTVGTDGDILAVEVQTPC